MGRRPADETTGDPDGAAEDAGAAPTLPADEPIYTPGLGSLGSLLEAISATPEVSPGLALDAGTVVAGSYRIEERLGIGGMGVVYLASDLTLGRKVAIKLHRRVESESAIARLSREAQAMARLSHPNVITVHQVGTYRTHVFIAMAYVPGGTLRRWLGDRKTPQAIIAMFVQAGRGLAAAHEAGLVHRDFKPDNVLISADGRALVGDFGLAQADNWSTSDDGEASAASADDVRLTATGARMGTPAYMAPEQHRGEPVDSAADQFSFCAALYEALCGALPYPGRTPEEILASMGKASAQMPAQPGVPARVRRAIERGLAPVAAERHPSMHALLDALDDGGRAARRNRLLVGAAALVVVGGGLGALALTRDRPDVCADADREVMALWSSAVRTPIRTRFESLDLPYATHVWGQIDEQLSSYTTTTGTRLIAACREARRPDSVQLAERRQQCLQERADHLRAVIRTLEGADATIAEHAVVVASRLPPLEVCDDTSYLLARVKPPEDPATAAAVRVLRAQLADVSAKSESGLAAAGDEIAGRVLTNAETLGYEPLIAEALLARGILQRSAEDFSGAEQTLSRAFFTARRSGDDETAAKSAKVLVWVIGHDEQRLDEADTWASHAESDLGRLGNNPGLRAEVIGARAILAELRGNYDDALTLRKEVLAMVEPAFGPDHIATAQAYNSLGVVYDIRGDYKDAEDYYTRAIATMERLYGPHHPALGSAVSNLGLVLSARGDQARSEELQRRALGLSLQFEGPNSLEAAYAHLNLGVAISRLGKTDAAIVEYERALEIIEAKLGPTHSDAGLCLNSLAVAYEDKKDFKKALGYHERALAVMEASVGARHPHAALVRSNIASVLIKLERYDEAIAQLGVAQQIWEQQSEPSPSLALTLSLVGKALYLKGRIREAVAPLERARRIEEEHEVEPEYRGRTLFFLSQALWHSGQRGARTLDLARQAEQAFARGGALTEASAREVRAWLRKVAP